MLSQGVNKMLFHLFLLSFLVYFSAVANTEEFQPLYPGQSERDVLRQQWVNLLL